MSILDFLTSLVAPDDCLACGREGALLCASCIKRLPPLLGQCLVCHKQVDGSVACSECLPRLGLQSLHAITPHDGPGGALVHALKFNGNQSAARVIARAMTAVTLPDAALLTHIPATTAHIRQRGYDQAQLICRQLARHASMSHASLLRRSGQHHQLGAGRQRRLQQMERALSVSRPKLVQDRNVVIIDDVVTTGSSLAAAARALRAAGARSVTAIVFTQAL